MRIVFCGACNPVFSLKDLASEVRRSFPGGAGTEEILLLLNGCGVRCLEPEKFAAAADVNGNVKTGKIICVAGTSVDGIETGESGLSETVIKTIKELKHRGA